MLRVAICGGGSLAHALAAVLGAAGRRVRVLTRSPAGWQRRIQLTFENLLLFGEIDRVSDDPADVIPESDLVFVEVPAFAHAEVLRRIAPFVDQRTWIGALPGAGGFDAHAHSALPGHERVFGSARTPYICRTTVHGESVAVTGVDATIRIASCSASETPLIAGAIEDALGIPSTPLSRYEAVNLTPSNPLVHTARIYTFFRRAGGAHHSQRRFYRDWDDAASGMLLTGDDEIDVVRRAHGITAAEVPPVRAHYGVASPSELTRKIRSLGPLIASDLTLGADLTEHRYFREDFACGLTTMASIARSCGARTPAIDEMLEWHATFSERPRYASTPHDVPTRRTPAIDRAAPC